MQIRYQIHKELDRGLIEIRELTAAEVENHKAETRRIAERIRRKTANVAFDQKIDGMVKDALEHIADMVEAAKAKLDLGPPHVERGPLSCNALADLIRRNMFAAPASYSQLAALGNAQAFQQLGQTNMLHGLGLGNLFGMHLYQSSALNNGPLS